MHTFNDDRFNIGFRTDVETPPTPMLKPFYVVLKMINHFCNDILCHLQAFSWQ